MELSRIEKGIVGHKCEWCGKRHGSFLSATLCCLPLKEAPPQRKGFDRHVDGRFVPAHWAVHPEPDLEVEA
jgi:hypothetical protein